MKHVIQLAFIVSTVILGGNFAYAGVPLNNLEGVGGIAFNPLAYPAGQLWVTTDKEKSDPFALKNVFSKPQFGVWYVNLNKAKIDWSSIGFAETLFKRLELSYGHEIAAIAKVDTKHLNNFGAKLLLVPENSFDTQFIPALSVGTIYKQTQSIPAGTADHGEDFYVVATKLITQLPRPVLLSGGVRSTRSYVAGVLGYDKKRDTTGFANIDILPTKNIAVGFEYEQGAEFKTFKNANYWETHVAWMANKDLTLVLAYVNTGDRKSSSKTGFADGVVLSAQYQF